MPQLMRTLEDPISNLQNTCRKPGVAMYMPVTSALVMGRHRGRRITGAYKLPS